MIGTASATGRFVDPAARVDLGAILRAWAAERPEAPFVQVVDGPAMTYGAFDAAVNAVARGLQGLGVERGAHVNLVLPNRLEYLTLSYALKKLGAVEVAIDADLRGAPLARALGIAGARVTVTTPDLLALAPPESAERRGGRQLVLVGDGAVPRGVPAVVYAEVARADAADPGLALDDLEPATVLFTSGSTGPSKGCVLSHRALLRAGQCLAEALRLTPDDRVLTAYPLSHMRAAYLDVLPALLVGGSVVLAPRFSASRFWRDLAEHDVTVFSLIGTVMRILWQRQPDAAEREHRVRLTWGGPITVEPADFERRFGVRVLPGSGVYGMSEIGMLCMTSDDARTSGRVRPPYEVRIASPAGDPLPAGETGEVLVRPREPGVVFDGYLNQPEATVAAWRGLWFHTGDLGRIDADGRFEFLGRRKDMIRRAGHNVSAAEVEEALATHPAVAESAAFGMPAPLGEEQLVVLVVPLAGASPTPGELVAHCAAQLAAFMVPDRVVLVDALPKTPTGKVVRSELAALAANGEEAP